MHILLTDILTCPRCGPDAGLILLAHRIEDRRVREGELGCPRCRAKYPIRDGTAAFGDDTAFGEATALGEDTARGGDNPAPGGHAPAPRGGGPGGTPDSLALAAMLGITEGPGVVLVVGPAARAAPGIRALVEGIEVVVAMEAVDPPRDAWPAVSRIRFGGRLPFARRSLQGVVLYGSRVGRLLEDAAGALAPGNRMVLVDAPAGAEERLREEAFEILACEGGTIVAEKRGDPDPPKLYQLA